MLRVFSIFQKTVLRKDYGNNVLMVNGIKHCTKVFIEGTVLNELGKPLSRGRFTCPGLTPTDSHQALTEGRERSRTLYRSDPTWSTQDPWGRCSETPEAENGEEADPGSQDQQEQNQDRNPQL